MKKILTLTTLLLSVTLSLQAQTDTDFQFVDGEGNVIADGTTVEITAGETIDDDGYVFFQMPAGIYLQKATAATAYCYLQYRVERIDNGALQICFPNSCNSIDHITNYTLTGWSDAIADSAPRDLQTEWLPEAIGAYGEALMTVRIKATDSGKNDKGTGATIQLHFTYDTHSAGISDISAKARETARYTIGGQRLAAQRQGINIVRMSNGQIRKEIVKMRNEE